mgnify:CR=1
MASYLTISWLAKSAGVHVQTMRYCERCYLLNPVIHLPAASDRSVTAGPPQSPTGAIC